MDDLKELLPLAARACGITPHGEDEAGQAMWFVPDRWRYCYWNPQTPGDGAEMEDKLKISVTRAKDAVCAFDAKWDKAQLEDYADHPDEGTARRWASLRVAAAIGRSMK